MWATRAWWLLRYAGHTNVKVLKRQFHRLGYAGYPVESGETRYPSASFTPVEHSEMFVDTEEMVAAMENTDCTINALSPAVYAGTGDVYYGRRGHIPGSRSIYFSDLLQNEFFCPPSS